MSGSGLVVHRGACHCGAVAIEVDAPAVIQALECSCSMCSMTGFLHLIVPKAAMRVLAGDAALTLYRFGTGTARHYFCRVCGVKPFYVPRSNPDGWDVNVRCLDPATIDRIEIALFDDEDRESAEAQVRHLSEPDRAAN